MDNEIDKKIDVTAIQSLLVENRQQTQDWTLIGSGANGIGIQVWGALEVETYICVVLGSPELFNQIKVSGQSGFKILL